MKIIIEMCSYPFIVRAFEVGILVSLCAALLGVSLVLKQYSMIGDGLSHVSFGALSVAMAFGFAPLEVSIPVVILAAFFLLRISQNGKMKSDAAIAVLSSSALALGVIVTAVTTGMNTDVCSYMFGSILAMSKADVTLSVVLSVVVLGLFLFCYHKIFMVTFDESFAIATGVKVSYYNTLIAILTAITIVLGMRMMGAMLISSLIIFPSLTSMRIFKSFRGVVICSGILSVLCFCLGLVGSYHYTTPAGASIVVVNLCILILMSLIEAVKKKRVKPLCIMFVLSLIFVMTGCSRPQSATNNAKMQQQDSKEEESTAIEENTSTEDSSETLISEKLIQESMNLDQQEQAMNDGVDTTGSSTGDATTDTELTIDDIKADYTCDIEADKKTFDSDNIDIVVGNNYYATQINDWYMNFDQYDGKSVEIEGYYIDEFAPYLFIGRYGPVCPYCQGGYVSFEIFTDEDLSKLQNAKDWIKVKGILRSDTDDTGNFCYIEVMSVEKMDEVGVDTVSN